MASGQTRLFRAPQPLVERLGVEFFRRVPRTPGVYLMTGEQERLLYVGQARCLRARLNSYRHVRPERASRKVVRLIHEVRAITWETCACPEAALLRENELLRRLKPRYNVMNVRPEQYCFIGVRLLEGELQVRLTRRTGPLPGETLHGAFKALGRVRAGLSALLRLLWAAEHRPVSLHQFPRRLLGEMSPESPPWACPGPEAGRWAEQLRAWLDGRDDRLLDWLTAPDCGGGAMDLSRQRLHEADCERLRLFHQFGPARNRGLRDLWEAGPPVIAPAELDDLLALRTGAQAVRTGLAAGGTVG